MAGHRIAKVVYQFCAREHIPVGIMCDRLKLLEMKYASQLTLARLRDNERDAQLAERRLGQISRVLEDVTPTLCMTN